MIGSFSLSNLVGASLFFSLLCYRVVLLWMFMLFWFEMGKETDEEITFW